ncbi:MAG: PAS domain-containing protein, partial [Gemmatimonadaceae bacterium]|nr:PAS domain-containing protein [Gemmatimonadaceae bacterium]
MSTAPADVADAQLHGHRWRAARPDELDDLVCHIDPALHLVSACSAAVALFARLGFVLPPGAPLTTHAPPAVQARWRPVLERALAGETIVADVDIALDGRTARYEVKVQPLRDASGAIVQVRTTARDVTRRAAAEERLREIEARHQLLLDGTEDGVFDWEIATGRVWFSPRALALYG